MAASLLPTEAEQLSDLICSGEMSEAQIDELIELHGHFWECETCDSVRELTDFDTPMHLLIKNNSEVISLAHRNALYDIFEEDCYFRGDFWYEMWVRKNVLTDLATGPTSDRPLLLRVAEGHEILAQIFRAEEGDDDFETVTAKIAVKLAGHKDCDKEVIYTLVEKFHSFGGWCSDEFESCDTCIGIMSKVQIGA